jgi:hypothetical protein
VRNPPTLGESPTSGRRRRAAGYAGVVSDRGDDDALSWDGDDDPTLTSGRDVVPPRTAKPEVARAVASDPGPRDDVGEESDEGAPALGNVALVGFGVLGGVYLLFAVGWLIGAQRLVGRAPYLLGDVMFQGSAWLAALAPALWFAAVLWFMRGQKTWLRFVWLAAGVVLLVPWPFAMLGTVGA